MSFSRALMNDVALQELAARVEHELGGPDEIAGGLLLATAAAGPQGAEVGRRLSARWRESELVGTSFEGLVYEGRVHRDQPALGLLAWSKSENHPVSVAFEPEEQDVERIASGLLEAGGKASFGPSDLVLLFPDAHGLPAIEPMLPWLEAEWGRPAIAGAAASGIEGAPPQVWVGDDIWPNGGLIGIVVPAAGGTEVAESSMSLVSCAGASRPASPWIEVTTCRRRWIDALEGQPALSVVRRVLGLTKAEPLEPLLPRLLVRIRRGMSTRAGTDPDCFDTERYIVGVDERRGGFSIAVEIERGDEIAMAWPDAALARVALADSLDDLAGSPWILQFGCRARGAELHGDGDVESAWVAAHAAGRSVLGAIAPFQLGPGPRLLVHSNVLAALVAPPTHAGSSAESARPGWIDLK